MFRANKLFYPARHRLHQLDAKTIIHPVNKRAPFLLPDIYQKQAPVHLCRANLAVSRITRVKFERIFFQTVGKRYRSTRSRKIHQRAFRQIKPPSIFRLSVFTTLFVSLNDRWNLHKGDKSLIENFDNETFEEPIGSSSAGSNALQQWINLKLPMPD